MLPFQGQRLDAAQRPLKKQFFGLCRVVPLSPFSRRLCKQFVSIDLHLRPRIRRFTIDLDKNLALDKIRLHSRLDIFSG